MPWTCAECTLVNADDQGSRCDLCDASKGDAESKTLPKTRSKEDFDIMSAKTGVSPSQLVQRKKISVATGGVFGVPLASATPTLVCDCMAYLTANGMDTEGLFRVPGTQETVDELGRRYEENQANPEFDALNSLSDVEVHDVGTLFKMFFRKLPTPLFPVSHYDALMSAVRAQHASSEDLVTAVLAVVQDLPSPNKELLALLLNFLAKVAENSDVNKMTPANLATCFAPSLLRAPDDASPTQALMDMSTAIGALNILIKVADVLERPSPQDVLDHTLYVAPGLAPPPGMLDRGSKESVGAPPGL